jgi:hypothetical protein
MKTAKLGTILTKKELQQAQNIFLEATSEGESAAARITAELIEPNLARINKAMGQENDPHYLGYAVEFALRANLPTPTQAANPDAEGYKCEDPTVCE